MRGPYAAEQVFTTGVTLSETESGTGVDSALLTTTLSDTDTGAGVDNESITRTTVALADLGIGQDSEVARTADLSSTDIGVGKDRQTGEGSYQLVVASDNPVGYWRLGEASGTVATDFMGSLDGTYTGTLVIGEPGAIYDNTDTSILNNAAAFGNYIQVPDDPILNPDYISGEMWVKRSPGPAAAQDYIILNKESQYEVGLFRVNDTTGSFQVAIWTTTSGTWYWMNAGVTVPYDGNWHYMAFTFDGTTVRFYVDGLLRGTKNVNAGHEGPVRTTTSNLRILARGNTTDYWLGAIDEVAIYPRVLTAADIEEHYLAGIRTIVDSDTGTGGDNIATSDASFTVPDYELAIVDDAPVGYWRLAETSGTTLTARVGPNGSYSGSPVFGLGGALLGNSNTATYLNSSSRATVPHDAALSPDIYSVEAWVLPEPFSTGYKAIIVKTGSGTDRNYGIWINGSSGKWHLSHGNGTSYASFDSVAPVKTGVWSHIVYTFDGSIQRFYLNGVLDSSVSTSIQPNNPAVALEIGGHPSWPADVRIDEVSIYNRALAADEVLYHYQVGSGDMLVDSGSGAESSTSSATLTQTDTGAGEDTSTPSASPADADTGTGTDTEAAPDASITNTDDGAGAEANNLFYGGATTDSAVGIDTQSLAVLFSQPDTATGVDTEYKVQLYFDFDSGTSTESETRQKLASIIALSPPHTQQRYEDFVLDGKPVLYWRLGEPVGEVTVADHSGNGFDGTIMGNIEAGRPGALASSTDTAMRDIAGSVDLDGVPGASVVNGNPYTYEIWMKPNATADNYYVVSESATNDYRFHLSWYSGINFRHRRADGTLPSVSSSPLTLGVWHHIVAVYDGARLLLYVNGTLNALAGGAITDTYALGATERVRVFGAGHTDQNADVEVDEVASYGRALTATEILRHYDVGSASRYGFGAVEPGSQPSIIAETVDAYQFDWATTPA